MNFPRSAEELFDPEANTPDPDDAITGRGRVRTTDRQALARKAVSDVIGDITDENDVREVLSLPSGAGVRFLARLLEHCNWSAEYFHPSNSVMSYAAGRRSICRDMENWVSDADLELWIAVRRVLEVKRQRIQRTTNGAAQTMPANAPTNKIISK